MPVSDWIETEEVVSIGHTKFRSKTSLASVESLSMPLVQEIVLSADIHCTDCQERVADMMSRMIETYSVLVSVLEKKVTLTCTYSGGTHVSKLNKNPYSKTAMIKRMLSRCSRR